MRRCLGTRHFTAMENLLVYRLWPMAGHTHCSNRYHAAVARSLLCSPNIAILIAYATHGNILHARGCTMAVQICQITLALRHVVLSCMPEKSGMQAVKWLKRLCVYLLTQQSLAIAVPGNATSKYCLIILYTNQTRSWPVTFCWGNHRDSEFCILPSALYRCSNMFLPASQESAKLSIPSQIFVTIK